jgi:hypothetical protein
MAYRLTHQLRDANDKHSLSPSFMVLSHRVPAYAKYHARPGRIGLTPDRSAYQGQAATRISSAVGQPASESQNSVATALRESLSSGIALLLWGAVLLYCPTYFATSGWVTTVLYVAAIAFLLLSVGVTFNELAKALQNASLTDLGGALVFATLTALLWCFATYRPFVEPWETVVRLGSVVSALIGAIFVANTLAAVPSALVRVPDEPSEEPRDRRERRTERIRSIEALLAAVLSLATTVGGLIALVLHIASGK